MGYAEALGTMDAGFAHSGPKMCDDLTAEIGIIFAKADQASIHATWIDYYTFSERSKASKNATLGRKSYGLRSLGCTWHNNRGLS